jgi:hypothetical protein
MLGKIFLIAVAALLVIAACEFFYIGPRNELSVPGLRILGSQILLPALPALSARSSLAQPTS